MLRLFQPCFSIWRSCVGDQYYHLTIVFILFCFSCDYAGVPFSPCVFTQYIIPPCLCGSLLATHIPALLFEQNFKNFNNHNIHHGMMGLQGLRHLQDRSWRPHPRPSQPHLRGSDTHFPPSSIEKHFVPPPTLSLHNQHPFIYCNIYLG